MTISGTEKNGGADRSAYYVCTPCRSTTVFTTDLPRLETINPNQKNGRLRNGPTGRPHRASVADQPLAPLFAFFLEAAGFLEIVFPAFGSLFFTVPPAAASREASTSSIVLPDFSSVVSSLLNIATPPVYPA